MNCCSNSGLRVSPRTVRNISQVWSGGQANAHVSALADICPQPCPGNRGVATLRRGHRTFDSYLCCNHRTPHAPHPARQRHGASTAPWTLHQLREAIPQTMRTGS